RPAVAAALAVILLATGLLLVGAAYHYAEMESKIRETEEARSEAQKNERQALENARKALEQEHQAKERAKAVRAGADDLIGFATEYFDQLVQNRKLDRQEKRKALEKGVRFLDRLEGRQEAGEFGRDWLPSIYVHRARLETDVGLTALARQSYRRALALSGALGKERTGNQVCRSDLAASHLGLVVPAL